MGKIYDDIVAATKERRRLLAILLDPDKVEFDEIDSLLNAIRKSPATHLFIGGSHVKNNRIPELVELLKKEQQSIQEEAKKVAEVLSGQSGWMIPFPAASRDCAQNELADHPILWILLPGSPL